MRDFLPIDIRKREYVIGIIKEVYESYGFEPLETPAVENLETLMGKYGEEGNQLIFRILKRGEKLQEEFNKLTGPDAPRTNVSPSNLQSEISDLALRYDLTVPLARVVANNRNVLPKFFKRYQIQPVWRADRPARGRFREFYQCDVDAIGSKSLVVEAEIISAAIKVLDRLGFEKFVVSINHRDLLFQMLDWAKVEPENQGGAITAIDKFDMKSPGRAFADLRTRGLKPESVEMLSRLYENVEKTWNRGIEVNRNLLSRSVCPWNETKDQLLQLIDLINDPRGRVVFQPFLARGLSYYTGSIFEILLKDGDFNASIGGGGRYDGLIGMFGKEQIPACGFSLGLERILVVMEEREIFPPEIAKTSPADVMVTLYQEEPDIRFADLEREIRQEYRDFATVEFARELRQQGLRVIVYPEPDKLGKQLKYANSIGVPFVCMLGEIGQIDGAKPRKEIKSVTLKNMKTGQQRELVANEGAPIEYLAKEFRANMEKDAQ